MNPILNHSLFFIKEKVGLLKASNNYDILDPNSKSLLLTSRETKMNFLTRLLRFTDYKTYTPFYFEIKDGKGQTVFTIQRGFTLFLSTVKVFDQRQQLVGMFKQHLFSIGGKFGVHDAQGNALCTLEGNWVGWNFKFIQEGRVFAEIFKEWSGLGKELFTSADNYMLSISDTVPVDHPVRMLILAAVLCVDMVLKEK